MGICIDCKDTAKPGKVRCQRCLDYMATYQRKRMRKNIARGFCSQCGKYPARINKTTCEQCRQASCKRARKRYAYSRKHSLCGTCGKVKLPKDRRLCDRCLDLHTSIRKRRDANGPRQKVLERDNHICKICSSDYRLNVHHIDGQGERDARTKRRRPAKEVNNSLENLITLCHHCHRSISHFNRCSPNLNIIISLIKLG